ncbi:hypothetical protein D3C87_1679420 [compost metagenome]
MPTATTSPGMMMGARMKISTSRFSRKGKRAMAHAVGRAIAAVEKVTTMAMRMLLTAAWMRLASPRMLAQRVVV